MLERYASDPCGTCGRGLTWIEIAFGRFNDPVCGGCLIRRQEAQKREPLPEGAAENEAASTKSV